MRRKAFVYCTDNTGFSCRIRIPDTETRVAGLLGGIGGMGGADLQRLLG